MVIHIRMQLFFCYLLLYCCCSHQLLLTCSCIYLFLLLRSICFIVVFYCFICIAHFICFIYLICFLCFIPLIKLTYFLNRLNFKNQLLLFFLIPTRRFLLIVLKQRLIQYLTTTLNTKQTILHTLFLLNLFPLT